MIDKINIDKEVFCNALLEAIPIPVLVVNPDVRILYYNSAATMLLGSDSKVVIQRRAGGGSPLHSFLRGFRGMWLFASL
jgi:PAS domain-containing protein